MHDLDGRGAASGALPSTDFVLAPQRNALAPGELLRCIDLPLSALRRRTAFRQISLSPLGRSGALLIGTLSPDMTAPFVLTVTAATPRPVALSFSGVPSRAALRERLEAEISRQDYYDDVHGRRPPGAGR